MKNKRINSADKPVAKKPGATPPHNALMMTAPRKKMYGASASTGRVLVKQKAAMTRTTATPYRTKWQARLPWRHGFQSFQFSFIILLNRCFGITIILGG